MKNLTNKILISSLALALPVLAMAQVPNAPDVGMRSLTGINTIITNLVGWVVGIFFVAAVLALFFAAYLYLTAGANPGNVDLAKTVLIYAVVAIAIALLATSVRYIVENVLRGGL